MQRESGRLKKLSEMADSQKEFQSGNLEDIGPKGIRTLVLDVLDLGNIPDLRIVFLLLGMLLDNRTVDED